MRPAMLCVAAAAFAYQLVAMPLYRLGPAAPDFVLIAVAYLAFHDARTRAVVTAGLLGLLVDAVSLDPWGAHALGYTVAAGVMGLGRKQGMAETLPVRCLLLVAGAAVAGLIRGAMMWRFDVTGLLDGLAVLVPSAVWNGILGLVIFPLLDPLRPRLVTPGHRRLRE